MLIKAGKMIYFHISYLTLRMLGEELFKDIMDSFGTCIVASMN